MRSRSNAGEEKKVAMPGLYVDKIFGVSNRRRVLPPAFAIRNAYGREIILDFASLARFL
jgi:hypothetical protein